MSSEIFTFYTYVYFLLLKKNFLNIQTYDSNILKSFTFMSSETNLAISNVIHNNVIFTKKQSLYYFIKKLNGKYFFISRQQIGKSDVIQ